MVGGGSSSKQKVGVGVEDSMASSSYMMSSAGKDKKKGGKTHIQVGALNYSAAKDPKHLEASS